MITRFAPGQIWASETEEMVVIFVEPGDASLGVLLRRGGDREHLNVVGLQSAGAWRIANPDRFELLHGLSKKRCRIVWKAKNRIGVSF